ncbi:MAG: ATP phosphoribosyltransferase regulatory subunit [Hyphomicrobium sp.]
MADKTLLPAGMVDVLPPHADFEAKAVESLMAAFASYGYERVKPPLMEFEDTFLSGAGAALASQAFRLMDPVSQRMLVLRPDMTVQVARIAVDRLAAAPRPLRLGYAGQVTYVSATQPRPGRQVGQVGVELIGPSAPQADAEIILMVASALAGLRAGDLTVDLAIPTLVPALVAEAGIDAQSRHRLRAALDRKDIAGVAELAGRLGLELTGILTELLALAGPCDAAMQALMALPLPPAAAAERTALARVVDCIQGHDFGPDLSIDPVENRGFEYHTGVTFALFASGVRGEIGRGGRYRAGNAAGGEPATGATLFVDAVMAAVPEPRRRPHRVFLPAGTPLRFGRALREQGWIAVSGFDGAADQDAEAQRLQCSHVLTDGRVRALLP